MERRIFNGSLIQIAREASEWLGCDREFIYQSYRKNKDGTWKSWDIPRYFEHYQQKHATLIVGGVKC